MFEVEQLEYEKEQIDWSYIKFNDNKVHTTSRAQNSLLCLAAAATTT